MSHLRHSVKLELYVGSTYVDYTNGLINANIIRGIQNAYQGPWQQPEAGVLTIVSRNTQLDPHINTNFRMGKRIRLTVEGKALFTGNINSINVDYQPQGEPPIVTITAVDMIGTMALHTLRNTFKTRLGSTMDIFGMNQELISAATESNTTNEIPGYYGICNTSGGWGNAATAPDGISALEMMTKLAQTDLKFFYADKYNNIQIEPSVDFNKDSLPKIQFDSRGGATSYRSINLTDGFDLLKNKITFTSFGVTIPTYTNAGSIKEWGSQSADIDIYLYGATGQNSTTNTLATNIFKQTVYPTREIDTVTFDAHLCPELVEDIDLLMNVYVYHQVSGFDISRKYGIIGISHNITLNDWETTFKLKNMFIYDTVHKTPTIAISPTTGTINTTFNYSISNLSDLLITDAIYSWAFGDGTTSSSQSPTHQYTLSHVGTNNVQLTFTNAYGFQFQSAVTPLFVAGVAPSGVSFTYTVGNPDTSLITFNGSIATNATSYLWNFGDGTTSTQRQIAHKYVTSGNKTVTYTAINAYGQTTSTQTINVTVPAGPTNEVGTWPIRWVRIGIDGYTASSGYVYPLISQFKALTSYTNTNRAQAVLVTHSQNYKLNTSETRGSQIWKLRSGNDANVYNNSSCSSGVLSADFTDSGIQPYMNINGTTNWSLILGLGDNYYDIKKFAMTFTGGHSWAGSAPTNLDIYITDYTGTTTPIDNVTWTKAGSINRSTGTWTPAITMPPVLP